MAEKEGINMKGTSQLEPTLYLPNVRGSVMRESELHRVEPSSVTLLKELLDSSIVLDEDFQNLSPETKELVRGCSTPQDLWPLLLEHRLVTEYQANRIKAGKT